MLALAAGGTDVPALRTRPAADFLDDFHLRAASILMDNSGHVATLRMPDLMSFAHAMELTADEAFELRDVLSIGLNVLNEYREGQRKGKAGGNGGAANPVNAGQGNERPK